MTTRTALNAGPEYWWFIDAAYADVDRLSEDECPMDEVQEAKEQEAWDRYFAALHGLRCPHRGMGEHLPENCPDGGV